MKKIRILCVGDLKEKYLKDAQNEYMKRLSKYFEMDICEVSEYTVVDKPNLSQIEIKKVNEGKNLLKNLKGFSIALCIDAKQEDSVNFAHHIDSIFNENNQITFIIGGSDGLSEQVLQSVNEKISFSKLTFPHQLMRIILLEQIYRSATILSGKTYHK